MASWGWIESRRKHRVSRWAGRSQSSRTWRTSGARSGRRLDGPPRRQALNMGPEPFTHATNRSQFVTGYIYPRLAPAIILRRSITARSGYRIFYDSHHRCDNYKIWRTGAGLHPMKKKKERGWPGDAWRKPCRRTALTYSESETGRGALGGRRVSGGHPPCAPATAGRPRRGPVFRKAPLDRPPVKVSPLISGCTRRFLALYVHAADVLK